MHALLKKLHKDLKKVNAKRVVYTSIIILLALLCVVGYFALSHLFFPAHKAASQTSAPTFTDAAPSVSKKFHVPILMYHHVGPLPQNADAMRRDLTVSPEQFEAEVQWLSRAGYTSITLEQVYFATQNAFTLPKKPVVFTFDDGYADVFAYALPILQKYNMKGSFAVVPGLFDQPEYTNWATVAAAKDAGMEIVSHTSTHFDGTSAKYDAAYIKTDLERSLQELDTHLGHIPRVLVYPYGHYTPAYIDIAKQVGFTMALTTAFGHTVDTANLMTTPRVRVHGGQTLERFADIVEGSKVLSASK